MALTKKELKTLTDKARQIREKLIHVTEVCGGAHIGGSLSQTDILVALYHKYMKIDPKKPHWPDRDRFILSKGHGGVGHAVVLGDLGFFPEKDLDKFNKTGTAFGMHLDRAKVAGVDASTGSLAHGIGIGLGMALGARMAGKKWRTYIVISDGECQEGATWEGALAGAQFKLTNCTVIVDRNRFTIDGATEDLMAIEPLDKKWEAFGWRALRIDGHDFEQICGALDASLAEKEKPCIIIADTVKGKGVDFMENQAKWHYGGLDDENAAKAMASIKKFYSGRA